MLIKNDFTKKEIFSSGAFYSAGIWTNRLLVAANTFIIIYFLSIYEYGVFKLIISLIAIFQIFLFSGFDGVVRNEMAIALKNNKQKDVSQIFFEFIFFKALLTLIIWIVLYLFIHYFFQYRYDLVFISILKIASFTLILNCFSELFSLFFKGTGNLYQISIVNSILEIIRLFFLLVLFKILGASISVLFFSIIIIQILSHVIYFIIGRKILINWWADFRFGLPRNIFKILFSHGKWSIFSNMFSSFTSNIINYIIKIFISTEAVAIYNVANSIVSNLYQLLPINKILTIFLPYKIDINNLKKEYFFQGVKYLSYLYIFLMVIGYVGGGILFKFIFVKYSASLPILYTMLLIFPFFGLLDFIGAYLYVLKHQKDLFWASFVKNLIIIILSPLFIFLFGVYGTGITYVIYNLIWICSLYLIVINRYPELVLSIYSFKISYREIRSLFINKKIF